VVERAEKLCYPVRFPTVMAYFGVCGFVYTEWEFLLGTDFEIGFGGHETELG
jgi:hypothetical protein